MTFVILAVLFVLSLILLIRQHQAQERRKELLVLKRHAMDYSEQDQHL